MNKMKICTICNCYTLQTIHCGNSSRSAHPAPFNPTDPHGAYRRRAKGIDSG